MHEIDLVDHIENYQKVTAPFQGTDDSIGGKLLATTSTEESWFHRTYLDKRHPCPTLN
jgi:hypothetical protein